MLLHGPPGCGKTHIVRLAASAYGLPLLTLRCGAVNRGIGGSAAALRDLYARAAAAASAASAEHGGRHTPALVFLDEIDAWCPKRSDAACTGEQARAVAQLLTLLDGLRAETAVVTLAATNRPQALDEALRRPGRFEWEVPLGLPSLDQRLETIRRHVEEAHQRSSALTASPVHPSAVETSGASSARVTTPHSSRGVQGDISENELRTLAAATSGFSGADLVALARQSALAAVERLRSRVGGKASGGKAGGGEASGGEGAHNGGTRSEAHTGGAHSEAHTGGGHSEAHTGGGHSEARVCAADWHTALRLVGASVLRGGSGPVESADWSEVGGLGEVKRRMRRAVEWPLLHASALRRLGVRAPRGILMHGPPGCSKTSLARAAAASAKASFLHLSGAEIYSPMVGEAEASVREFFARGRAVAPAVLLLDELDAIVGKRDGGGDGGDAVQQRVLSTLLNEVCRLLTNPFAPYVTPHFPLHVYITHPFFLTRWTA